MDITIRLCSALALFSLPTNAKLLLDNYNQLETNLITSQQPAPSSTRNELSRDSREWVKISTPPPTLINTRLGERVEIECEAMGSPAPEVQWFRGSNLVSHKSGNIHVRERDIKVGMAKMKSRLVIECVTRKHEGFYNCVGRVDSKSVKANPTLLLVEGVGDLETCTEGQRQAPRIVSWTPTALESQGADIKLPCVATGMPAPTVFWLAPDNNVLNGIRHQVSSNGDLTISRLTWSDMGEYTCVAQSSEGRDTVTSFVYPYSIW